MFRVLIVDDEELALVSLQYSFPWREYGFTDILTATDSREALEILKNQRIDAAFVDIRMPNLSGLDLAGLAQESGLDTIFVIVSGYSDFAYAKEAIGYGVLDYCLKPVSEEEAPGLLSKLRSRILSRRYSHDSQYAHSLLAEEGRCRDLLHHMFRNSERKGDMALLYLCGSNMWDMLSQWDSFPPEEVLFWGEQDALLLWGKSPAKDLLEAFFAKYEHSALLLYDVAWPDVLTFQNALRRIRMERELSETGRTGVVRFLSISDEMKSCFGSLIAYMEENFAQSLTLKDLAHHFGINYTYLSQQFTRVTGRTFSGYLTAIRLKEACRLLEESQLRIVRIAEKVGYSDYHYFNNVFKHQYGMTPLAYRKAIGKEPIT